jgi:hypothetical protein
MQGNNPFILGIAGGKLESPPKTFSVPANKSAKKNIFWGLKVSFPTSSRNI